MGLMISNGMMAARRRARRALLPLCVLAFAGATSPALAADCMFEPQGEGRVIAVIDSRTFRLEDGREVRLAGIEPVTTEKPNASGSEALAALIINRSVTLRGENDSPDRYGRQPAFVFLDQSEASVQSLLVK
jgi:endonuclease YncB( thermonuclease family)